MPHSPPPPPKRTAAWQTLWVASLGLIALAQTPPAAAPSPKRVFVVSASTVAGRLRAMGKPGDFALRNTAVTAVVRKSDGFLVDFWPNVPVDATVAQLAGTSAIDGLWLMHPTLMSGTTSYSLAAERVSATADGVEAVSTIGFGAGDARVTTLYRLDGDQARLIVTTRVEHVRGGKIMGLSVGDSVKWGNVDYFVEGFGRTPPTFSGKGQWVGRRGASGDLVLRSLESSKMRIDYRMRHAGLAPEISVVHHTRGLVPGESFEVRRVLEYSSIVVPPKPRASGTLELRVVDENGLPLAAKLSFRGVGRPDPDFGSDGGTEGAGRFVWSGTGRFSRELPVGTYRVLATAGIERAAAEWKVEIAKDQLHKLEGKLPRVIETPGWLSADLHLHQAPSVDADISYAARLISVAAEGVELAVPTDHYVVTDLRPTLKELVLSRRLVTPVLTLTGTEVSTVGNRFGHFGLFPTPANASVSYEDTTPRAMFADMRRAAPEGLIQVNHPRWDQIGYFNVYRMDPKSARIPAQHAKEFDPSYDLIEVYNGYDAMSVPKIRQVLHDWMRLLGQGHRYAATGNSDSHKLFYVDPGLPRNLIHWGDVKTDAEDFRAGAPEIVAALRAGRVQVTSGPVLDVSVDGKGIGETASGGRDKQLKIRVRAAPWVDVSEVEVLLGPAAHRVRFIAVPHSTDLVRLETSVPLKVPAKTFVVVVARGSRDLPNVYSAKVRPFAFTNPIWLEP